MPTAGGKRYVSPAEAAKELGLSKSSVHRAISAGELPVVQLRPDGALRIPVEALEPRRP